MLKNVAKPIRINLQHCDNIGTAMVKISPTIELYTVHKVLKMLHERTTLLHSFCGVPNQDVGVGRIVSKICSHSAC